MISPRLRRSRSVWMASSRMSSASWSERRSFTYARCVLYGSILGAGGGLSESRLAGRPHRGQSQDSGICASTAKVTTDSWACAQKYTTVCRGAASPRSASPIGPAPTRLPRIALPPPATLCAPVETFLGVKRVKRLRSAVGLQQQTQSDDAREPDHARTDRDPVEVALGHRGTTQTAGHAASEHVGEPAAPAFVQQDEQDQQEAGQDEQHGEGENHGTES